MGRWIFINFDILITTYSKVKKRILSDDNTTSVGMHTHKKYCFKNILSILSYLAFVLCPTLYEIHNEIAFWDMLNDRSQAKIFLMSYLVSRTIITKLPKISYLIVF